MKVAVVGSREFKDKEFVKRKLKYAAWNWSDEDGFQKNILVSGGAKGVDSWAEEWWREDHHGESNIQIFKPNWDVHGNRAGAIRNQQIVDAADYIVAFWDGKSKGTKITIDMALKAGKPLDLYVRN